MSMNLARTEGALFAYVLAGGRAFLWIFGVLGVGLFAVAVYGLLDGAMPLGIAALTGAGIALCLTQAVYRDSWTFILPSIAIILAAGAVGYGVYLVDTGQVVFVDGDASGSNSADQRRSHLAATREEPAFATSEEVERAWAQLAR